MKETKRRFPSFAFYDRAGIEDYLEKQAEKGWLLEKIGWYGWQFRRIRPQKLRFSVTYFPQADFYDPEPGEGERTFQEFCAHSGWTLAASSAQLQIFYTDRADAVPIETDPVMEVEKIHQAMKKSSLRSDWIMVVCALLQLAVQGVAFCNRFIRFLSDPMLLFFDVLWAVILLTYIGRIAGYYSWRRKAKAAAEEGLFLKPKTFAKLETAVYWMILLGMLAVLAAQKAQGRGMGIVLGMIPTFLVILVVVGLREKLRREGYDANTNKIATIGACVLLTVLVTAFVTPLVTNREQPQPEDPMVPLSLAEFQQGDFVTLTMYDQASPLLSYLDVFQGVNGAEEPRLEYELVTVKAAFLYDMSLKAMLDPTVPGVYQPTDPAPWGAKQAWQFYRNGEPRAWYLLAYEEYILELIPSWEMTVEEKSLVGSHFS